LLSSADIRLLGVAADSVKQLQVFSKLHEIPYTLLSDPQLTMAETLEVPTFNKHPMSPTYPKGAFLQPAFFVWSQDGKLVYQWRQTAKLKNLFGASGRPSPEQIISIARESLG
jgi:peroxiredoxin